MFHLPQVSCVSTFRGKTRGRSYQSLVNFLTKFYLCRRGETSIALFPFSCQLFPSVTDRRTISFWAMKVFLLLFFPTIAFSPTVCDDLTVPPLDAVVLAWHATLSTRSFMDRHQLLLLRNVYVTYTYVTWMAISACRLRVRSQDLAPFFFHDYPGFEQINLLRFLLHRIFG